MSAIVSARASESTLVDMLNEELALCAAARAETGVPVRMDRVRVGVPLAVAFAGEGTDDVGVDDRGVLEDAEDDDDAWLLSVEDAEVRPDAEELGFLVAADMVRRLPKTTYTV